LITVIAIANAVLWSGVILFLLLRLIRGAQEIEEALARLESGGDDPPVDRPER
jgi:hypothetical protein